jgi:hypothetical protein
MHRRLQVGYQGLREDKPGSDVSAIDVRRTKKRAGASVGQRPKDALTSLSDDRASRVLFGYSESAKATLMMIG